MSIKEKIFERELKKVRKENKERFEESKKDIKEFIDKAEHTVILSTDHGTCISANSVDLKNGIFNLLKHLLLETDLTVPDVLGMVKMIKEDEEDSESKCIVIKAKSKEEAFNKLDKEIAKLKKDIDKKIKEEVKNNE